MTASLRNSTPGRGRSDSGLGPGLPARLGRSALPARSARPTRPGLGRRSAATAVATALLASLAAGPALAVAPEGGTAGPESGSGTGSSTHRARGTLLSVTPLDRRTRAEVADWIAANDVDADPALLRHGTASYRITYATVTPDGEPTTASALFVLPTGGGNRLATVSATHGTTVYRGNAPSTGESVTLIGALLYASGGRAVVAPDYLGLGTGPGSHPYVDTHSSVTASVDALRAASRAAAGQGRHLTRELYATGFSQGGQVAMALGRALADDHGGDGGHPGSHQGSHHGRGGGYFRLRALAPISGPYDIEGVELPGMFDGRIDGRSAVIYLSFFLTAQNKLHPLYEDPREVFRAPYADHIEELFDSDHTPSEIVGNLPGTIEELLTDEWYAKTRRPTGTLARVIRLNDGVCRWAPRVPVRLHTASGDRDVPIGNSRSCAADLAERGTRAEVIDHGGVDHGGAYRASVPRIAAWFARLG